MEEAYKRWPCEWYLLDQTTRIRIFKMRRKYWFDNTYFAYPTKEGRELIREIERTALVYGIRLR